MSFSVSPKSTWIFKRTVFTRTGGVVIRSTVTEKEKTESLIKITLLMTKRDNISSTNFPVLRTVNVVPRLHYLLPQMILIKQLKNKNNIQQKISITTPFVVEICAIKNYFLQIGFVTRWRNWLEVSGSTEEGTL